MKDRRLTAKIEAAYSILDEHEARAIALSEEEDRHRLRLEEIDAELEQVDAMIVSARVDLAKAILAADPRPLPTINDWFRTTVALWQFRAGNRIYSLVPARGSDVPEDIEDIPSQVSVAIVEVESDER